MIPTLAHLTLAEAGFGATLFLSGVLLGALVAGPLRRLLRQR